MSMTPEQKQAITPHLHAVEESLQDALQELNQCMYTCDAANATVNALLDSGRMSLVSIISNLATIKAVQMDVEALRAWCEEEQTNG